MKKIIDFEMTVAQIIEKYPECSKIMADIGFKDITNPALLKTVGKIMTVRRGAAIKKIPMENIIKAFEENGFEIKKNEKNEKTESLKGYLKRLSAGEDLDLVQKDFVKEFKDVEAADIMKAEQELIDEGTPLPQVQKLCDVHSALFHGSTREEKIANAEKEVAASYARINKSGEGQTKTKDDYKNKNTKALELSKIKGHPLYTFKKENDKIMQIVSKIEKKLENNENILDDIKNLRQISVHYAKKGDLIYPQLKSKYNITGPSNVMWAVDGEIRNKLAELAKSKNCDENFLKEAKKAVKRAKEMVYKEENILFPICAVNFSENDWKGIYRDSKEYQNVFDLENELWLDAEREEDIDKHTENSDEKINFDGGSFTKDELEALLDTLPFEVSFVDKNDINRFFNNGEKVFKRPKSAIGREVYTCHPPKAEPMVRSIISDFKNGLLDKVPVWLEKGGKTFLITYFAVRDKNKNYLGTLETVQDMSEVKLHFEGK